MSNTFKVPQLHHLHFPLPRPPCPAGKKKGRIFPHLRPLMAVVVPVMNADAKDTPLWARPRRQSVHYENYYVFRGRLVSISGGSLRLDTSSISQNAPAVVVRQSFASAKSAAGMRQNASAWSRSTRVDTSMSRPLKFLNACTQPPLSRTTSWPVSAR